ncbi:MAG: hypothetical protein M3400_02300 [Actinomycetota bacterium]|nr:hypothetical protein [Actinomycetota bacterium]
MSSRKTFDLSSPATITSAQEAPAHGTPAVSTDDRATADSRPSKALSFRRGFLVAAPVLAGVLATVGAVADPAAGISGDAMIRIYADNMDRLQYKSLAYHWSYAFWILPAMLIVPMVRGRGAWLATITGFIGFLGVSTMPGLLMSDFFDSAIGAAHGIEGHREVLDALEGLWGVPAFILPGILGLLLALPLAMITLWRAGLARWWGFAAAVAAMAAFLVSDATWPGTVIATLFLGVVSLTFAKATQPARRTA